MKKVFILLCLLIITGLGYCVYYNFQPQDLSDIDGYRPDDREQIPLSLSQVIGSAAKTRQAVELTERQVNSWLAENLKAKQEGLLADYVTLKGIWVRFEEEKNGRCEIIVEREVHGHPHTVSMYVRIERKKKENGSYTTFVRKDGGNILGLIPAGGRFGQVRMPQGFLLMVAQSFESLAELFSQELEWMEQDITRKGAGRILFEEHKMRIDFPDEQRRGN